MAHAGGGSPGRARRSRAPAHAAPRAAMAPSDIGEYGSVRGDFVCPLAAVREREIECVTG